MFVAVVTKLNSFSGAFNNTNATAFAGHFNDFCNASFHVNCAVWTDGIAVDDNPGVEATIALHGFSAQKVIGISERPLRLLLERGEVEGKKLGHDWVVLKLDYKRKKKITKEAGNEIKITETVG